MSLVPLIAKPRILALKNKWTPGKRKKAGLGGELLLLSLSLVTMLFLYLGTMSFISESALLFKKMPLSYGTVLTPFLIVFLTVVFLASAVRSLGTLFLSRDVEFLLSAPISKRDFFAGKFFDALLHSIWTFIVFGLPIICAFDTHFHKGGAFILWSSIILLPCFLTAAALAMTSMVLFASIVPANRTRDVLLAGGCLFGIVLLLKTASYNLRHYEQLRLLASNFRRFSSHFIYIGPPQWASQALLHTLQPSGAFPIRELFLLFALAFSSIILAVGTTSLFHFYAYSKSLSPNARQRFESRHAQRRMLLCTPIMTQRFRAIFSKELRLFARDMTQTIQLILLLSICIVYIYNFRLIAAFPKIPEAFQGWWEGFLLLINIAVGSLLMSAVCTRFVFPSISLEGSSYWVIQSSPMSLAEFLNTKLMVWFYPIGFISCTIISTGALAIDISPGLILVVMLMSWIIAYGLCACSIGLGAFFADFDWDYSAQVSANFASILNMFVCTLLCGLNLIPVLLLIASKTLKESMLAMSALQWFTCVGLSLILLAFLNLLIGQWALGIGENALQKKFS